MSWHRQQAAVGTMGEVFRGNEAEARRTMVRHGIKPPRPCSCPNPALHTDYDGDTSCLLCGRRPA